MASNYNSPRRIYLDYLRVFASFAVIVLHVSAYNFDVANVQGSAYMALNFYDSIVRWGTPVFVMISGALFLSREISIKKIYHKYILRIGVAFVFWSAIYSAFEKGSLSSKIKAFLTGHYHMWFLFMIVGLYMCIPFIKAIVSNDYVAKYYVVLAIIFAFAIPETSVLIKDFAEGDGFAVKLSQVVTSDVNAMYINIVLGYTSYFILGYLINKYDLSRKTRIIIYVLGIMGGAFTIVVDYIVALKTNMFCDHYFNSFNLNVMFEACAIFTLFKYEIKYDSKRTNTVFCKLSEYTFGIYLVHVLVRDQLNKMFGLNSLSFNSFISVLFISGIVFILSTIISATLKLIPVIKRYIV